ncbi:MAG: DUF5668 domain-containing protein [Anaerolineales bacterium]
MNENPRVNRKGSLVWPILLICFGIVFLLNNLGMVDWDVWMTILRLWPVLLIVFGLDILLGRRPGVWSIISVILVICLFTAGAWLIQTTQSIWAGETYTHSISQPINDADQADVRINFGVGELNVGKTTKPGVLVEGELDVTEDEYLNQEYTTKDDIAYLQIESTGPQYYPSWILSDWGEKNRSWTIDFTDDIPIDLSIDTGIGKMTVDLEGINLVDLNIDSGIGETSVYLPSSGSFNAWISLGIGELAVYIPEDLMVRIHMDTGLGNSSISGDYIDSGNIHYSPGFDDTGEWVELYVDSGIGDVRVIQVQ